MAADKYDTNPFAAQRAAKGSKTVRRQRCGDCTGCKAIDCGKCKNCMNMKKFGGTLKVANVLNANVVRGWFGVWAWWSVWGVGGQRPIHSMLHAFAHHLPTPPYPLTRPRHPQATLR